MVVIELRLRYATVADLCSKYIEFPLAEHVENGLMHSGIGAMSIDIRPFSIGIILIPVRIGSKLTGIALIQIDIGVFSIGITLIQFENGAIPVGIVSKLIENGMIPICIGLIPVDFGAM